MFSKTVILPLALILISFLSIAQSFALPPSTSNSPIKSFTRHFYQQSPLQHINRKVITETRLRGGAVQELVTHESVTEALSLAKKQNKKVVLDFSASWCGPCKVISPLFNELSLKYKESHVFIKIDVDENVETAQKYEISAMPTFVFIDSKGGVVDRMAGANGERLTSMVENL